MQIYKASLDKTTAWISIGFTALILALIIKIIFVLQNNNFVAQDAPMYFFIIVILIGIWVISFLRQIKYYSLSDEYLIIQTRWEKINIPIAEIIKIEPLNLLPFSSVKNIGRRALFGYRGTYKFPSLGHISFYASQKKNLIYLQTEKQGNIIISPDDISLLDDINEKLTH